MNGQELAERPVKVVAAPLSDATENTLTQYRANLLDPQLKEFERQRVTSQLSAAQQLIQQMAAMRAAQRVAAKAGDAAPMTEEERQRREEMRREREEEMARRRKEREEEMARRREEREREREVSARLEEAACCLWLAGLG